MKKWSCLSALALLTWIGLAQAVNNNNGGAAGAFDEQQQARDLTGKRGQQQVDLFTGSFGYSIPIACAPARNGSEPALGLAYSSGGENGWCGMGWKLEIGHIERNTKDGFPIRFTTSSIPAPGTAYDDTRGFLLNLFGKEAKLLVVATNGATLEYRAETDTDFIRCFLDTTNNKWTVYDKSGTAYYFGQASSSRVVNPKWTNNYSSTFQWALDQIDTTTGDRTTVGYATYTNQEGWAEQTIYPTTIAYNGHASINGYGATNSGVCTISFGTELRPDRRISYRWGFRTEQNRRLTNIVCQVGSQNVCRYAIAYTTSLATRRSLLSSVTVYGSDDTTALPAQTFAYQQNTNAVSFGQTMAWTNMNLADVTGAGGTDPYVTQISGGGSTIADLFDIDGDGLPDRVSWDATGSQDTYQVQRNNGSGGFGTRYTFGPSSSSSSTTASDANPIPNGGYYSALNSGYTRIRDINGDGLPDRICDWWKHFIYYNTYEYTNFEIMINTGSGFGTAAQWPLTTNDLALDSSTIMSVIESGSVQPYVGFFDINGDGLPDRVMALYNQPETYFKVQFNTGTNFMPVKYFGPYRSQNHTNNENGIPWSGINTPKAMMIDMNGDGLPDHVMMPMDSSGTVLQPTDPNFNYFAVEFNNGFSFESTNTSTGVPGAYDRWPGINTQTSPASGINYGQIMSLPYVGMYDLNGDGLPDRVMLDESAYATNKAQWLVYLNNGRGFDATPIQVPVNNQGNNGDRGWCGLSWSDANNSYSIVTTLIDINGDGLLDRVMKVYDNGYNNANTSSNFFLVQLNNGPFPDLLTNISNGLGGTLAVTYKSSTAYDNRKDPTSATSGSVMPYPMQTVATVTGADGINPARTTSYGYAGGYYDGPRREFHGFAMVTVTNPPSPIAATYNRRTVHFFHQGGGQNRTNLGEYLDPGNFAKDGIPFRVETYGNDNNLYHVTVNLVNQASLGYARYFPFTQLTFDCDYPSGSTSTPKVTATQFAYDPNTGNLTNKIEFGLVTGFNPTNTGTFSFSDATNADTRYYNTHYTTIGSNIVDHPDDAVLLGANNAVIQETRFTYDSLSGVLKTKEKWIAATYFATNSFGYNSYGMVNSTTDPVGVQTSLTYDSTYNTFPATATVGSLTTTTTYDARSGLLTSSKAPTGVTTTNSYDALSRPVESDKIAAVGSSSVWIKKFAYPGSLKAIVGGLATNYTDTVLNDGVGGYTNRSYIDGFGRGIQSRTQGESGNFRVVSTAYDELGNAFLTTWPAFDTAISFKKPGTNTMATWIGFDAAGRIATNSPVTVAFDGNGAFSSKTDSSGDASSSPLAARTWRYVNGTDPWWIIYTDEDGKVRQYGLDAFGRTNQIQEIDGGNTYNTTLNYDLADNLTNIVNANSENIYYAFDNAGGMVAMADPYLGQWKYQRDFAGRLRVQTDGRTNVIKLSYVNSSGQQDPLGRVQTKEIYSFNYTNHSIIPVFTNTYVYDTSDDGGYVVLPGLLYKTTDSEGFEKNSYDSFGRLVKTTRHLNITSQDYTTIYTYNDGDKVASIVYPNNGPTITNTYFHGGSLNQVSRGSYNYYTISASGYDEFGHATNFLYGNSLTTTRGYYAVSKRLQSITCGSIFSRTFTYSNSDDIASIGGTGLGSNVLSVTYDNLHRVKTYGGLTGSYNYDPVGNILTNIESGSSLTYSNGVRRPQAVKTVAGKKYLYDLCGNMIVRQTDTNNSQALAYDAENHLVRFAKVATNFTLVRFGYGADGERLWKWMSQTPTNIQVWIGNIYEEKGGKTLFHVYAGGQQVCTFETNSLLMGGTDMNRVGYYYHEDNLNSSSALSSSSGAQQELNVFYPFGRVQTASPQANFQVSRRFTGQVFDSESGLYYFNKRYYDPELGRFTQANTVIQDLANPQSYNRYSYCINDPLRYTDPTGLDYWSDVGGMYMGYYDAGASLVTGMAHMIAYPINSAQGVGYAATHLRATGTAIANGVAADWNSGARGQGKVLGDVFLAAGMAAAPAAELGNLSKINRVASIGGKIEQAAVTTRNVLQDIFSIQRQNGLGDIAAGTRAEAEAIGKAWVNGKNANQFPLENGGYGITDGTRTFRLQFKPKDNVWKANFQENVKPDIGKPIEIKNVHMEITDMKPSISK